MAERNHDLSFRFRRALCYLLALVMAGSVVLSVAVGIASGLLRTESFVQKRYETYISGLLEEVNTAIAGVAETTGLPTKAYTSAIQEGHIKTALHQAANNTVKGFNTDFTESTYLYSYYHAGILNYCKENGVPITEEELNKDACFAVDAFNEVVGDESTSNIIIFALSYTKNPLKIIVLSIIAFVASLVAIDFISFGRHKKFDYMGVGLIVAGETLVVLPFFAIVMKYTSSLRFMDVDVYNMALADVLDDIMRIYMIVGVVVLLIGIIVTVFNYRYYAHKSKTLKTEHDIRVKLMKEQREHHQAMYAQREAAHLEEEMRRNQQEIDE